MECEKEICVKCSPSRICSACRAKGSMGSKKSGFLGRVGYYSLFFAIFGFGALLVGAIIGWIWNVGDNYYRIIAISTIFPSAIFSFISITFLAVWSKPLDK